MNYYLQLEGSNKKFRLQKDKTWRLVESKEIGESDLLSLNDNEFINLQKIDSSITLEGVKYSLNSTSYDFSTDIDNELDYQAYVHRVTKPTLPSKEQLISVIASGSDNVNNSVILKADSQFSIIPFDSIDISIKYPSIIARNSTFVAGNDYIGLEASKDERLMDEIYNQSLECWLTHLLTGKTNMYADDMMRSRKTEEIIAELNRVNI